jgi:hypothetical protein
MARKHRPKPGKRKPEWLEYEEAIVRYYAAHSGYRVTHDVKIENENGRMRQIDVLLEITAGPSLTFRVAIEAKHRKKPITSKEFDAIRTVLEGSGADVGHIFCPAGLEKGPKSEIHKIKHPRIVLHQKTIEDLVGDTWGAGILNQAEAIALAKNAISPDSLVTENVVATLKRIPVLSRYFFYCLETMRGCLF